MTLFPSFVQQVQWPTGDKRTRIVLISKGANKKPIAPSFRSFCIPESKAKTAALGAESGGRGKSKVHFGLNTLYIRKVRYLC
jgi:hypothetical protein